MKKTLLLSLVLSSFQLFAQEKMPVHLSCYLPLDIVSCDEIKNSFFRSHPGMQPAAESAAFLSITLRSLALNNTIEYQYSLKGKGDLPQISFNYPLNDNASPAERFEKILSMMGRLSEPYKLIANYTVPQDQAKEKPYYVAPIVSGLGSKGQGSSNFSGGIGMDANYSTQKWRLIGSIGIRGSHSAMERTAYSPGITVNTFRQGANVAVIRSFGSHWNFAVIASDLTINTDIDMQDSNHGIPENGLSNDARRSVIAAGAEWILVPFLTEESNGNISLKYVIGAEHNRYVDPETFKYVEEAFAKHTLLLVVSKHFKKVDVALTTSAFTSQFRENVYTGMTGGSTVSYKVSDAITLDLTGGLEYAKGRIPSPAASTVTFAHLTSGNQSLLTYNGSITVRMAIGNVRLNNRDQRFKSH